ncbi:MAG: hypothetical protein ACOCXF_03580 [bacterium]
MRQRIIPSVAGVWEIIRYILIVNLLHTFLNPLQSQEYQFFFFWVLSYAFATLLGTALTALRPLKFQIVARAVGVVKLLQLAAGLLLLLYELGIISVILAYINPSAGIMVPATIFERMVPLLLIISVIDLLTGIILLKYKPRQSDDSQSVQVEITEVDNTQEEK